jgi:serine/threonine-protein kinase
MMLGAASAAQAVEWGSIYFSPSTHATGFSHNYDTQRQAERAAISYCSGGDCIKAISFRNACGALAIGSNGGWGADWGRSGNAAQRNAVNACRTHDSGCRVVRWQCSQ